MELKGGTRITGQLKIPKPEIGMEVEGTVEKVRADAYDEYYGIVFSAA